MVHQHKYIYKTMSLYRDHYLGCFVLQCVSRSWPHFLIWSRADVTGCMMQVSVKVYNDNIPIECMQDVASKLHNTQQDSIHWRNSQVEASPGPSKDLSIAQKVCLQYNNNIIRQVSKFLHVLNIVQELKFNSIFLLKVQHKNNNITRTSLNLYSTLHPHAHSMPIYNICVANFAEYQRQFQQRVTNNYTVKNQVLQQHLLGCPHECLKMTRFGCNCSTLEV